MSVPLIHVYLFAFPENGFLVLVSSPARFAGSIYCGISFGVNLTQELACDGTNQFICPSHMHCIQSMVELANELVNI